MAAIDFIADEEAPDNQIDFTPDPATAVAQAPRPIIQPQEAWGANAYVPQSRVAAPQFWQDEYRGAPSPSESTRATAMSPYGAYVGPNGQIETRIPFDPSKALVPLSKLALTPQEVEAGMEALASPFLSEKDRKALMESPLTPSPLAKSTSGFTQGAYRTAESLTSPMNLGLMVGTAGASEIPAAARLLSGAFATDMARQVPEMARNLGEAVGNKDPEAIARAATELAATGAFTTMAGTHAVGPRVMLPETMRELAKEPSTTGEPNAVQEQSATETVRGLPQQPVENAQLPAQESGGRIPSGGVPSGDAQGARRTAEARAAEVSLKEQPILLTPTVRIGEQSFKGKAHPLAIGEASKKLAADAPIEDLFKPESQGFTATDPATGKERFVTRKEAADIFEKQTGKKPTKPDHLTSEDLKAEGLLGHLDENAVAAPVEAKATAEAPAKPEVVRQGNSRFKNPQGDPLGTTYRATPEDYARYQDIQKELVGLKENGLGLDSPEGGALFKENEAIKNRYGGMPPEAPKATTTEVDLPNDITALARLRSRITNPELRPQIDAKIAELKTDATPSSAALKQLPPVPAGHVRLFHGEGGPQGGGTGGAFYTSNIAKASTFGPDVSWVDLPTAKAQAAYAKAKRSAFSGGDNFILEAEDIGRSKKINQKVEQPTHNLDEPAAQPSPRGIAASARVPGALKGGEAGSISLAPLEPVAKAVVDFVKAAPTSIKVVGAQLAGKSAPKTSTASVESGNTLVRYASSKIAAPLVAESMATDVLGTHYKDAEFGKKLGAVLVEDRLRGIKDAFTKAGDNKAARKVNSLIGQPDSPFKTETEFQAALADPEIRTAIERHKKTVQPTAEAAHEEAGGTLAGPGLNTGAFVNLKAIFEGGEEALLSGGGRGNLMNPLRRPSRFSKTAAGTAEKYETDYRTIAQRMIEGNFQESTKRQMYDQLVKDGLAEMKDPGEPAPEIGGKPAVKFVIERKGVPAGENKVRTYVKNLWVRADLAGEVRQALDVDGPVQRSAIVNAATLLNRIQLAGPTDAVWHTANMLGSIAGSQGGKNVLVDMARKLPGVNLTDAVGRVVASSIKVLAKTPDVQRQIAELADIGAMRAKGVAKEGRLAKIAAFNHNVISLVDKAGRLVRDDMYQNLVRRRLVEDTPANRREWVNQMGQYNGRLMGQFQRFFKDAGFSPFVVAGRNFNRMAMRRITMDPGIKAISPKAAVEMRAIEAFGTIATLFAVPALANYLLTGTPAGRPGTKMGQIDTGKDDDGKHIVIDPAQWTGHRRGMRISGLQAVIEGAQRGETRGRISQNVIRDVMGGVIHPWAGPAVNAASVGYTGYSPTGYKESENPKDYGANILAALKQLNPAAEALLKSKEKGTSGIKEIGMSLGGAAGLKTVKPFTSINKMGVLHQSWMANNPDPKVKADYEQMQTATFPVSKYKALDDALAKRDEAGAISAIADLKAEGQKNRDILHRMRPFVGEGINSRTKPLFHELHKLESAFRNSLNAEQKAEYQKALAERNATYQEFLKAWRKRDTAPKTGPEIDFVPDAGQ